MLLSNSRSPSHGVPPVFEEENHGCRRAFARYAASAVSGLTSASARRAPRVRGPRGETALRPPRQFATSCSSSRWACTDVGTGLLPTLRWRGMDSKFQFRDASPPPTAWAPSFRRMSGGSWSRRNSSIGLPRPTTARVIPPPGHRSAPTRSKPRKRLSGAELKFRIHSPPAESPSLNEN